MELSHRDGKLRVHYSDKLVSLLREVRQLAAFGFAVLAKIQHTASIAHKFYRHGVILKQVYHLHTKMCFYIACTVYSMYIHVNLCKLHFDIGPEEMSAYIILYMYMPLYDYILDDVYWKSLLSNFPMYIIVDAWYLTTIAYIG